MNYIAISRSPYLIAQVYGICKKFCSFAFHLQKVTCSVVVKSLVIRQRFLKHSLIVHCIFQPWKKYQWQHSEDAQPPVIYCLHCFLWAVCEMKYINNETYITSSFILHFHNLTIRIGSDALTDAMIQVLWGNCPDLLPIFLLHALLSLMLLWHAFPMIFHISNQCVSIDANTWMLVLASLASKCLNMMSVWVECCCNISATDRILHINNIVLYEMLLKWRGCHTPSALLSLAICITVDFLLYEWEGCSEVAI